MPPTLAEGPVVSLSFANNFWGKDDAGVVPLLDRMQAAKQTCDELRTFYNVRASIEEEYSRKLLSLCRKPLGSQEMASLRTSLDTLRGEVEAMAKQHQHNAAQMRSELEEPLAAFAGGMKERRKIIQVGVEKLLKAKVQQTQQVNKTRDRYEQECLKIKGYLAQGHMVMGQEERKNKAKLEKTQISVATSNTEYENAVRALEDTTTRWNREWKAAADKFQDLEEERLDFTKSSLWQFANIASTVCVSDDASCEKIRLALEKMDVETDIMTFIKDRGTGQEIPDPPKYINFCRGDVADSQSEASEDDKYSVAQFPRSINPAFRSSSPQPSTFESHHDPNSTLAQDLGHRSSTQAAERQGTENMRASANLNKAPKPLGPEALASRQSQHQPHDLLQHGPLAVVPHDPFPLDGMTMLCRTGPPSERSSHPASARPSSRDSQSDYSNPTSMSSQEMQVGKAPTIKNNIPGEGFQDKKVAKKKSGFFQNHSPFRRKSTKEVSSAPANRNTWHAASQSRGNFQSRPPLYLQDPSDAPQERTAISPEPIDANANLALNVGQNVFHVNNLDVASKPRAKEQQDQSDESDPIAVALAELKAVGVDKQPAVRMSADRYHGIATPGPGSGSSGQPLVSHLATGRFSGTGARGTPPPSYEHRVERLGVPPQAVTAKAMKETSQKFAEQTRSFFGSDDVIGSRAYASSPAPGSRPATRGRDIPTVVTPASPRNESPRPNMATEISREMRSTTPNPSSQTHRNSGSFSRSGNQAFHRGSPDVASRSVSPAPYREKRSSGSGYTQTNVSMQVAPVDTDEYQLQYGSAGRGVGRPGTSASNRAVGLYDANGGSRQRSKSVADPSRQYTRDGRPILHFARAMYMYQAAIPEELGFSKGDILAILRHQDDGWWEAEVHGSDGRAGLVPSNYLQAC